MSKKRAGWNRTSKTNEGLSHSNTKRMWIELCAAEANAAARAYYHDGYNKKGREFINSGLAQLTAEHISKRIMALLDNEVFFREPQGKK